MGQKVTKVLNGTTTSQVLGPNPHRVGVILCPVDTGNCWVAFGEQPNDKDGIRLTGGSYTPFLLLFDSPNDYITQPLFAYAGVLQTISIVELIDREP